MHISFSDYILALRCVQPARWLLHQAHHHLLELCATCRGEWDGDRQPHASAEARLPSAIPRTALRPPDLRHFLLRHYDAARCLQSRMRAVARRAREDLARLRRHPAAEWPVILERSKTRYRSLAFVLLLLEETRKAMRTAPREADALAALVPAALARVPGGAGQPWAPALRARAAALRANALRIAGDLQSAERVFAELYLSLAETPLDDAPVRAEIASLEASLFTAQNRTSDAEKALDRAARAFLDADDHDGFARTRIKQASLTWRVQEDPKRVLALAEEAAARLAGCREAAERHLPISIVTWRVIALCELHRSEEAGRLLEHHRRDYEEGADPFLLAVLRGLEGRLAFAAGDHAEAERCYVACRDGHLALGRNHDAALASLDVADTLLAAGKTAELRELAASLVPLFRSRGIAREALASLRLLAEAVTSETISAAVVARVRKSISGGAGRALARRA